MEKTIIGIDPGAGGGIAVLYSDGAFDAINMPETQGDIAQHLARIKDRSGSYETRAYIEILPGYMGTDIPQSVVAVMFENFGFIKGILQAYLIPTYQVKANIWMASLGIGTSGASRAPKGASEELKKAIRGQNAARKRDWKNRLKAEAQRRYPQMKMTLSKCDAVLIMDYGVRQLIGDGK